MTAAPETTSMMLTVEFVLDLRRGVILCDAPDIDDDIPTWMWQDMLRRSEWRAVAESDDIAIHVTYYIEFELEDQRPDPNGVVVTVSRIEPQGQAQLVTGRCDILMPVDSALAEDLMHTFRDHITAHAEESYG